MALLAAFCANKEESETLEMYLNNRVFAGAESSVIAPDEKDIAGFNRYMEQFKAMLEVEKTAVDHMA